MSVVVLISEPCLPALCVVLHVWNHTEALSIHLFRLCCMPVLNHGLALEREGQVKLEGISDKGGGTLPSGDGWRKIFATRSTMQVYCYLFNLPKLRCCFNSCLPIIPSGCPESSIISLLADCLTELGSLGLLSSLLYIAFTLGW